MVEETPGAVRRCEREGHTPELIVRINEKVGEEDGKVTPKRELCVKRKPDAWSPDPSGSIGTLYWS